MPLASTVNTTNSQQHKGFTNSQQHHRFIVTNINDSIVYCIDSQPLTMKKIEKKKLSKLMQNTINATANTE